MHLHKHFQVIVSPLDHQSFRLITNLFYQLRDMLYHPVLQILEVLGKLPIMWKKQSKIGSTFPNLALVGSRRVGGRPKKYWGEVIRQELPHLQITDDMITDYDSSSVVSRVLSCSHAGRLG